MTDTQQAAPSQPPLEQLDLQAPPHSGGPGAVDDAAVPVSFRKPPRFSAAEAKVLADLDENGDGVLSQAEMMRGVKLQAATQQQVRTLRRQLIILSITALLGMAVIFGLSYAAVITSKTLFLTHESGTGVSKALIDGSGNIVEVGHAQVSVPLDLAPFLTNDQLHDIEEVGYYDCEESEQVWSKVISVRKYEPVVNASEESFAPTWGDEISVQLLLASGRSLIVQGGNLTLHLPEEDIEQELCGELKCAYLHLNADEVAALEQRAGLGIGRRLQRGNRGCRGRCQGRGRGGTAGGRRRRRRAAPALPAPTPAPLPVPIGGTPEQIVAQAAQAVLALIQNNRRTQADLMGLFVRLAFHDAGGLTGGANGCVDLTHSSNLGLQQAVDLLAPIVTAATGVLSQADVWVLASNVAIQAAGGPSLELRKGRIDVASCVGAGAAHPDAEQGHAHITQVFVNRLGFSTREIAALMGAHVLGRAVREISGYNGRWVTQNDRFTNSFYTDLIDRPWSRQQQQNFQGQARVQWNGRGDTMMLNTDIEMAFDTSGGCNRAGGGRGDCPRATHGFSTAATEFSESQSTFFTAFTLAYAKLTSLGSSGLVCAMPDCSTPS